VKLSIFQSQGYNKMDMRLRSFLEWFVVLLPLDQSKEPDLRFSNSSENIGRRRLLRSRMNLQRDLGQQVLDIFRYNTEGWQNNGVKLFLFSYSRCSSLCSR
jgi:hypothetical protein